MQFSSQLFFWISQKYFEVSDAWLCPNCNRTRKLLNFGAKYVLNCSIKSWIIFVQSRRVFNFAAFIFRSLFILYVTLTLYLYKKTYFYSFRETACQQFVRISVVSMFSLVEATEREPRVVERTFKLWLGTWKFQNKRILPKVLGYRKESKVLIATKVVLQSNGIERESELNTGICGRSWQWLP